VNKRLNQEIVRRVAGLFALANQLEQRLAQARRQLASPPPKPPPHSFWTPPSTKSLRIINPPML
jgi:hypothetical protein